MHPIRKEEIKVINAMMQSLPSQSRSEQIEKDFEIVVDKFQRLVKVHTDLKLCTKRRLEKAAEHVMERGCSLMSDLCYEFASIRRNINQKNGEISYRFLFDELRQLEQEFGGWAFNKKEQWLSVETNDIELEGVYLGRFKLRLYLEKLSHYPHKDPLDVLALDPHSPYNNSGVTHPHVNEDGICAGDASAPMGSALRCGRICDFFMLARSVLETYYANSAYVKLENWFGEPCYECGSTTSEDDRFYCDGCNQILCSDCYNTCTCCDATTCMSCLSNCSWCDESLCTVCLCHCNCCKESGCRMCMTRCTECHERFCGECIEGRRCVGCLFPDGEPEEAENEEETDGEGGEEAECETE